MHSFRGDWRTVIDRATFCDMDCRVTVVTLGVADLERSRHFYENGLGWRPAKGSDDNIVFFSAGAVILVLYPRDRLAEDAELVPSGGGFGGVTISQNVGSPAEVDAALAHAVAAGGTLLKKARTVFWGGYSGYFADPDGHPWEVAHNPHWELTGQGLVRL
jgi:catechol 2,3-dioxygenase-like lactoylglutathione lyase family enzyme